MWKCRKCGRSFRNENQSHFCGKAPETVDEYISEQDAGIQEQLQLVRKAIRDELPEAKVPFRSLILTSCPLNSFLRSRPGAGTQEITHERNLPTGYSIADSKELIQMNSLEIRNRKIIDAVIRKEQAVCPGAIALIGIYGSFQTGDIHPLSDLDLLVLINDDRGWQLGKAFIQEDLGVGHDIYCTTRESLRQDAEYDHPHISKMMDAQIVYCADEKYRIELETLREQVRKKLAEPFGEEDYRKAEKGDRHLAFMSLESLNEMLNDISSEVDIGTYDVLSAYEPGDLRKTADGFDRILRQYLKEYEKAGLRPARYADVDEFAAEYMRNCGE